MSEGCIARWAGVEQVSWHEVHALIAKLNRGKSDFNMRLPTKAEWEYACRAWSHDKRYDVLDAVAWYGENSNGETHAVRKKAVNAWGLYDMLGNIWEWCSDGRREYGATPVADPSGAWGDYRGLRGGSWSDTARYVRAACRFRDGPDYRSYHFGFRLARCLE